MIQARSNNNKKGFSLVEIVIGAAIITIAVLAAVGAYNTYVVYALQNSLHVRGALLLEEGMEAVKYVRDEGWSNITDVPVGTQHYLLWNGAKWTLSDAPELYVDGIFERSIEFETVYRNGMNDIDTSGVTDPDARKVTVSLSYKTGSATTTKTVSTYIMNVHGQ